MSEKSVKTRKARKSHLGSMKRANFTKEGRKVVPWVEVRSQIEWRNATRLGNRDHALGRDSDAFPLVDRLRSRLDKTRKSGVSADSIRGKVERTGFNGLIRDGANAGIGHTPRVHRQFIRLNRRFVADLNGSLDNQPMVEDLYKSEPPLPLNERLPLAGFATFQGWLVALLGRDGMKAACARAVGTTSQGVNKWLKGSIPEKSALKALADWAGADFFDLQLKTYQIDLPESRQPPRDNERWTETAKGAMVGRRWEELHRHDAALAEQFASLLDGQVNTLLKREQPRQQAASTRRRA